MGLRTRQRHFASLRGLLRARSALLPWARLEGAAIALVGIGAAVLMGVRLAVLGMAAGAFIFSFAVGLRGLLFAGLALLTAMAISPGLLVRFESSTGCGRATTISSRPTS